MKRTIPKLERERENHKEADHRLYSPAYPEKSVLITDGMNVISTLEFENYER